MTFSTEFSYLFIIFASVVVTFTALFVLDDLFIDFVALVRRVQPISLTSKQLQSMKALPQKHIAVMIANWKEYEVIGPMIRGNIQSIDYGNYTFFLGVYPNDTETWEAAALLEKRYPGKVVVVVNSRPGPTSKGQMLNEVAKQIVESEKTTGKKMDLFLLQDSEDVVHRHAFTILNHFSREADFLQVPVFSFDVAKSSFVGGVYIDEFSESHTKDMLVRQELGAAIPSAGVGTCISRKLVVEMMRTQDGALLKEDTLTEDYHLGILTKLKGFRSRFVCVELTNDDGQKEFVATREYFPAQFAASVRQKSRWTLGIVYQGSANLGWSAPGIDKYFLFRDRKGPACSLLVILSLIVLLGLPWVDSKEGILQSPFFSALLLLNALAMGLRILQRGRAVLRVHDWSQALMVPVRWLVANAVNVFASLKAHRSYQQNVKRGTQPVWLKTEHRLPAQFGAEIASEKVN